MARFWGNEGGPVAQHTVFLSCSWFRLIGTLLFRVEKFDDPVYTEFVCNRKCLSCTMDVLLQLNVNIRTAYYVQKKFCCVYQMLCGEGLYEFLTF